MGYHKILKKAVCLLCIVSILFSLVSVPTFASEARVVTATTSTTVKQGSTATCYVYIDSMESLAALDVTVHFDNTKVKIDNVYNSVSCTLYDNAKNDESIQFSYIFDGKGSASQTRLFYFTYQVLSNAEIGDAYFDITIGEAYDASLNDLSVSGSRCSFTIAETVTTKSCSVSGTSTVSTSVEEEFSLTYTFSTYQIASGSVVITYDHELFEVVEVTEGKFLENKASDVNTNLTGSVYVSFAGAQYNTGWDFVTVKFKTLKNVAESSTISFKVTELLDKDLNPITCSGCTTTANVVHDASYVGDAPKMWVDAEFNEDTKKVIAEIKLEENSRLGAGDFVLTFDPEILTFVSYEQGFNPDFFYTNEQDLSNGVFKFFVISMEDILSEETVVTVVFDAKQDYEDRVVSLDLSGSILTDSQTNTIALNLIDGSVTVPQKKIISIDVTKPPSKVEYFMGEDLDLAGGKLTVLCDDGASYILDLSEVIVTGFDSAKVGEQILTVTYNGISTTFNVTVVRSLSSIAVTQKPSKQTYLEGESAYLDTSGMVVTAYYDNGTSEEITGYTTSGYKSSTLGVQTITVSYSGMTTTFTVTVKSRYFASGLGTAASPFVIETAEQLNYVRMYNYEERYFVLANDIEFTDWDFGEYGDFYNEGAGWEPIGKFAWEPFVGVFDGNGHKIKNLHINVTSDEGVNIGLFGYNEGTIKNLGLVDCSVSFAYDFPDNAYYVGSVAGGNSGVIKDCYNTGSVCFTAEQASYVCYIGGIVGYNWRGTVENCYNAGTVSTSDSYVGGIVGGNVEGTIVNCYNTGAVTSTSYDYCAGIVGDNFGPVSNCYNIGAVSGQYAGTIAGGNYSTIENCYYADSGSKGVWSGTDTTTPCTVDDLMQQSTFVGFDFGSVWTMGGNSDYLYPELQGVEMQYTKELVSIDVRTIPGKYEYLEGKDVLDLAGGYLTLNYSNGSFEIVPLSNATVTGFDNTKVGEQSLTATYNGMTATFKVKVVAKSLSSISITTLPTKLTYVKGDTFDAAGMEVTAYYNNGTSQVITDYTLDYDFSAVGDATVTVSCEGKTDSFVVTVEKGFTLGDINGDGKINGTDSLLLQRYNNGWTDLPQIKSIEAMDINGDGKINGTDALLLQRYNNGWDIEYFR